MKKFLVMAIASVVPFNVNPNINENSLIMQAQSDVICGGSTGISLLSSMSPLSNPSLMSLADKLTLYGGTFFPAIMPELSTQFLTSIVYMKPAGIGLSIIRNGNQNLSQYMVVLGSGIPLYSGFNAGISLLFSTIRTIYGDIYGQKNLLTGVFAISYVNKPIAVGFRIFNPFNIYINKDVKEIYPQEIAFGSSYFITDMVVFNLEVNKFYGSKLIIRAGLISKITDNFGIGISIHGEPLRPAFGINYENKLLSVFISAFYHSVLGFSPGITISTRLYKKRESTAPSISMLTQ